MILSFSFWILVLSSKLAEATNTKGISYTEYKYDELSGLKCGRAIYGHLTDSLYLVDYKNSPDYTIARKLDKSETNIWVTGILFNFSHKMFDVDSTETLVHFGSFENPLAIISINATNGDIFFTKKFCNLNNSIHYSKLFGLSNGIGYYFISLDSTVGLASICKYIIISQTSVDCHHLPNMSDYTRSQLKIGSSNFFIASISGANDLLFYKFSFGASNLDWSNKISFTSSINAYLADSAINSDNSLIYSLYPYGTSSKLHLIRFNYTNGSTVGNRYISDIDCHVYSLCIASQNYLVATLYCGTPMLLVLLIDSFTYKFYNFRGNYLNDAETSSLTNKKFDNYRVIAVGQASSTGIYSIFNIENVDFNYNFVINSSPSLSVETADPPVLFTTSFDGVDTILITCTPNAYTKAVLTYNPNFSNCYSITVDETTESYLKLVENSNIHYTPTPLTSASGTATVSYSIVDYNSVIAPSWVTISSVSGELTIDTPSVLATNDYSFLY